ncbi:MAG: helix-turn-helix domain-containing protein [Spirochaetia bacterium]|nr:helix-turn-helix domain-containing protein [Spirochaetia bacterium]
MTLLTQKDVAEHLKVSRWTVKRWTEKDLLPHTRIGKRAFYIKEKIDRKLGND